MWQTRVPALCQHQGNSVFNKTSLPQVRLGYAWKTTSVPKGASNATSPQFTRPQDVNDEVQILTYYILCFRGEPQRSITCNMPAYFIVERFCRKGLPTKEQNVCNRQFVIHVNHNDPPALVIMNSNPPDMSKCVARKT